MLRGSEPEPTTPKGGTFPSADGPPHPESDVTLDRLNDQIRWYEGEARRNNIAHKTLRVASLAAAATIPVLAALNVSSAVAAALGAGIVAAEGVQGLFQFHRDWVAFAATGEALKREKFLYLASAGRYRGAKDAHRLLAEQVEALVAQETSDWSSLEHVGDGTYGKLAE